MSYRKSTGYWDTLLVAAIVLVAGVCAQSQQAAWAAPDQAANLTDDQPEGRIVEITPGSGGEELEVLGEGDLSLEADEPSEPTYWIGIQGRRVASPVVRTQLQLADDLGVVVESVLPDSPAAKAGLRRHDIILRADGEPVLDMSVLQSKVLASNGKPIELELIRLAKETKLAVTPELMSDEVRAQLRQSQGPGLEGGVNTPDQLRELLERMRREGGMQGMQVITPKAFFGGGTLDLKKMPGGLSVKVERDGDNPAQITITQGDKTWNISADDEKAIDALPDSIRPFVKRMLRGGNGAGLQGFHFREQLPEMMPDLQGDMPLIDDIDDPMIQRMEKLEQQLKELQQRLDEE